jgi:cyclophilin family peptidyl-prolyl cis-trans isomerase
MKLKFILLSLAVFLLIFSACKKNNTETKVEREVVVIETSFGEIIIDLFENVAPNHVANIKKLIGEKFYDGLYFHRVIPGFMIQGGDPNTRDENLENDGLGQDNQPTVIAEFSKLHHTRGIVSMARKGNSINSGTSQFFIMVADNTSLDEGYSIFGKVVKGMEVVDKIVAVPRDARDNPIGHVYMNKVTLQKKMVTPSPENEKK